MGISSCVACDCLTIQKLNLNSATSTGHFVIIWFMHLFRNLYLVSHFPDVLMVEGVLVNDMDDVCIRIVPPVKLGPQDQTFPIVGP